MIRGLLQEFRAFERVFVTLDVRRAFQLVDECVVIARAGGQLQLFLALVALVEGLDMELDAIPDLRAAIAYCESHKDYVSRELFDEILRSEEEHVDWLETQLDLIDKVGLKNYQQSQI